MDSNTYYALAKKVGEIWADNFVIQFIRSSVWPTVWTKKLVSIDGKLLEDSNGRKIVKIGAIHSQFGLFLKVQNLGKINTGIMEHWYWKPRLLISASTMWYALLGNLVEFQLKFGLNVWRENWREIGS